MTFTRGFILTPTTTRGFSEFEIMKKIRQYGKHEYKPDYIHIYEGEIPGWRWCDECGKYIRKPTLFETTTANTIKNGN